MRCLPLSVMILLCAAPSWAESIGAPHIAPNDTWTYQNTVENRTGWHQDRAELSVERAGAMTIAVQVHQPGSTMPPKEQLSGPDWSRMRSVNGHETIVNRPVAFPLSIGKTWEISYSEDNPNRVQRNVQMRTDYKVVGWEDITVPAGTFHALKIEADGRWTATLAPAVNAVAGSRVDAQGTTVVMQSGRVVPKTATGRTYKAFWYVPAVKRWVKSVEEYYDSNDVRSERYTEELTSFHPAD